ncbi:MAG: MFS transporter [Myxococcales bacterium]|nr:MFS transporter [Myxococcales bacterium]
MPTLARERKILFLLGAVQFVNILDFMIVMPLGPDFARDLGIAPERLGLIGGSYTGAAFVSGIIASRFLDRFDRRRALAVAMLGLVVSTALGGFATGLKTLMVARMLAGSFGGPATSLALSIVADVVPAERRGKALGAVMGAFSVASVAGVPVALRLAQLGSWRTPFFAVAAMGLVVAGSAVRILPPLRAHLDAGRAIRPASATPLWTRKVVLLSWTMTALVMMSTFSLIPYISPYLQYNLAYPRDSLDILYMVGGVGSFAAMRLTGRLTDRFGEVVVAAVGTTMMALVVFFGFVHYLPGTPILLIFASFMIATSIRNVPMNTLTSKVPAAWERGQFISTQSAVSHASSSAGAILASSFVHSAGQTAPLSGIPTVAAFTMTMAALVPLFLWAISRRLKAAPATEKAALLPPTLV